MKKTFTIILFLLFTTIIKSQENCFIWDSTVTYTYNLIRDYYDSVPESKIFNRYDALENKISQTQYQYVRNSESQNLWENEDSTAYCYDSMNNQISQINFSWVTYLNEWEAISKYEYAYDNQKNKTLYQSAYWDNHNKQWDYTVKYEYEFDENGNLLIELEYRWSDAINNWYKSEKKESIYDVNNNKISFVLYKNSGAVEQTNWYPKEKEIDIYNEYGDITAHFEYTYNLDSLDWQGEKKSEYTYNSLNRLVSVVEFSRDEDSSIWINKKKTMYEYNESGIVVSEKDYNWNTVSNEWYEIYTNLFNDNGDIILYKSYNYKTEFEYDNSGNLTLQNNYKYVLETDDWELYLYSISRYNFYDKLLVKDDYKRDTETGEYFLNEITEYSYDFAGNVNYYAAYKKDSYLSNHTMKKLYGNFYYLNYKSQILEEEETICQGDSIFWRGEYLKSSGKFNSKINCDTIHVLALDVVSSPDTLNIIGYATADPNSSYFYAVSYDSTLKYDWFASNGEIISQPTDSTVEVSWDNTTGGKILLLTTNNSGCVSDTSSLNIDILVSSPLNTVNNDMCIYPNPANKFFTISFGEQNSSDINFIEIFNILGDIVYKSKVNSNTITLEKSTLKGKGIYIINIIDKNGLTVNSGKILIQ